MGKNALYFDGRVEKARVQQAAWATTFRYLNFDGSLPRRFVIRARKIRGSFAQNFSQGLVPAVH